MGRPLTGRLEPTTSGRWAASLPTAAGSRQRLREVFDSEGEARAWLDAAIAARKAGKPIPDRFEGGSWLAVAAEHWYRARYEVDQKASRTRGKAVRNALDKYVLVFFVPRWPTPGDVSYDDCVEFARWLAGRCHLDGTPNVGKDADFDVAALRKSTASNVLGVLRDVLDNLVERGLITRNVAANVTPVAPLRQALKRGQTKSEYLSLADCARLAANLHVFHQTIMWTQRLGSLRVGEAYGFDTGDVVRGCAEYRVGKQGGRDHEFWDADGELVRSSRMPRLKTSVSERTIPLPTALAELVWTIEDAFHTLPDGTLDAGVPLIPGILNDDRGLGGYQSALKASARAVGLPETISSNDLRGSLMTDLTSSGVSHEVQRRYCGHAPGKDEHAVYLRDDGLRREFDDVVAFIDAQVAELGTIMVPTSRFPKLGCGHRLADRVDEAREVLRDRGWLVDALPGLRTVEVASLIGYSETQTRRLIETGVIAGTKAQLPSGGVSWSVEPAEVERFLGRFTGFRLMDEAAEELGLDYHRLYALFDRFDVKPARHEPTGRLLVSEADLEPIRAELTRLECLASRSMRVTDVARTLGVPLTTVKGYVDRLLVRDPETDAMGAVYVTRESVAEFTARLRSRRKGRPIAS